MRKTLTIKKGIYKHKEYIVEVDDQDLISMSYDGTTIQGRLLYEIYSIGGISKYIDKYLIKC